MSTSTENENITDSHVNGSTSTSSTTTTMSDDSYVEYAYQTALGRSSDATGKSTWLHELQSGHIDRTTLLTSLSASPEGQEHAAAAGTSSTSTPATATSTTLSDDAYVEYAYQSALGRSSDAAGKANWLHELQSGQIDRTTLLTSLSASTEGQEHAAAIGTPSTATSSTTASTTAMSDDAYLDYAYQNALGRTADAAGKSYWLHELQTGHVDRTTLLHDFSASAEGQEHVSLMGVSTASHTTALLA